MLSVSALLRAAVAPVRRILAIIALLGALPVAANELLKWNDVAAKAAGAGGQNPIQQTRTVAMVQGAVHDALNAIQPRYAAYYYEGRADSGAAPDAAIAAATRTRACRRPAGFRLAPAQRTARAGAGGGGLSHGAHRACRTDLPRQNGVAAGRGRCQGDARVAQGRWRNEKRFLLHAVECAPGRWRPHPNPDPPNPPIKDPKLAPGLGASDAARLGQRDALHAAVGVPIPAARTARAGEREVHARLQRSEVARRPGEQRAHGRTDRDRALLVRGACSVVSHRMRRDRSARARHMGGRARSRTPFPWRWPMPTSPASRSATSMTSGGRSPRSAKPTPTATMPPSPTRRGTVCQNTPSVSDYPVDAESVQRRRGGRARGSPRWRPGLVRR